LRSNQLIKIQGLYKSFKNHEVVTHALQDINMSISDGELISIEGPSGSGKSTLLSLLGLLDNSTSGSLYIRGQEVSALSHRQKAAIRNQHIGWVFQNFNLINNLTSIENVSLPLRYNPNIAPNQYTELSKSALTRVGLADKLDAKPTELSGGQQQRVAIARAIACSPSVLLADEPTGNLDSSTSSQIIQLLLDMSKAGVTIIIVTHDDDVAEQCHRRIKILDGKVINDLK